MPTVLGCVCSCPTPHTPAAIIIAAFPQSMARAASWRCASSCMSMTSHLENRPLFIVLFGLRTPCPLAARLGNALVHKDVKLRQSRYGVRGGGSVVIGLRGDRVRVGEGQ